MNRVTKPIMVAVLAISLSSCAFVRHVHTYCAIQPDFCIFAALAVGGVIIALAAGSPAAAIVSSYYITSDRRLKTDIKRVKTLDNGLRIYSFQYRGDNRHFVGVIAQDVLKLKKFRHAVRRGPNGYLQVNYGKLGLNLYAPELFAQAGRQAEKRAK